MRRVPDDGNPVLLFRCVSAVRACLGAERQTVESRSDAKDVIGRLAWRLASRGRPDDRWLADNKPMTCRFEVAYPDFFARLPLERRVSLNATLVDDQLDHAALERVDIELLVRSIAEPIGDAEYVELVLALVNSKELSGVRTGRQSSYVGLDSDALPTN